MPKTPGGCSIADDAALVAGKATAGAAIAGDENDPGNLRLEGRARGKPARIADAGSLVVGAGEVPAGAGNADDDTAGGGAPVGVVDAGSLAVVAGEVPARAGITGDGLPAGLATSSEAADDFPDPRFSGGSICNISWTFLNVCFDSSLPFFGGPGIKLPNPGSFFGSL
jgi:hypothetical protein